MVARYLQKLSHLTPSDRFCKYRSTFFIKNGLQLELEFSVDFSTKFIIQRFRDSTQNFPLITSIGPILDVKINFYLKISFFRVKREKEEQSLEVENENLRRKIARQREEIRKEVAAIEVMENTIKSLEEEVYR